MLMTSEEKFGVIMANCVGEVSCFAKFVICLVLLYLVGVLATEIVASFVEFAL